MAIISNKKVVRLFLILWVAIMCILYSYCIMFGKPFKDDVTLSVTILDTEIKSGQDIVLEIDLTNNGESSVYNAEITTALLGNKYKNSNYNSTSKSVVELKDKLHLRAVYQTKELNEQPSIEVYSVKKVNVFILLILLIVYILISVFLCVMVTDSRWSVNLCLCLDIILLSILMFVSGSSLKCVCRDDNIIHSMEEDITVKIDGYSETIKVYATYTDKTERDIIDINENGVPDIIEKLDTKKDTDGDGLPDYYEMYICGTDFLLLDSNVTGVGDRNYDIDSDGLSNIQEFIYGTNPVDKDTDSDGLDDMQEFKLGTNPVLYDTDSDGMYDSFEVEQGYNPLIKDTLVCVTQTAESSDKNESNRIKASVTMVTDGFNAQGLRISDYSDVLINDKIPGYIGSAFNVSIITEESFGRREYIVNEAGVSSMDHPILVWIDEEIADIESCKLSFEIDESWFHKKDFDPCIYYYDLDTQHLEEVETEVHDNIVSAELEHFSVYVVLNRTEVLKWMNEAVFVQPKIIDGSVKKSGNKTVCILLDISHSMEARDPEKYSYELIEKFIDGIDSDNTKVGLMAFTTKGDMLCDYSTNYDVIKHNLDTLERDSGHTESSGTNIYQALLDAKDSMKKIKDTEKYVVLVSDGDTNSNKFDYKKITDILASSKISLYTLHLGNINSGKLGYISNYTGGRYYLASSIQKQNLDDILIGIEDIVLADGNSSANDGLSDYAKLIIESKVLRTGTGLRLFEDINFEDYDWMNNPDVDGDGLSNGEEISVAEYNGHYYIKLYSNPFDKDTDGDGILDNVDISPFAFNSDEAYNEIIHATITLVCAPTGVVKNRGGGLLGKMESGHAWLMVKTDHEYTLINEVVTSGYLPLKLYSRTVMLDKRIWHTKKDLNYNIYKLCYFPNNKIHPYTIKKDESISIGHYPLSDDVVDLSWVDDMSSQEFKSLLNKLAINGNSTELKSYIQNINSDIRYNQEYEHISHNPKYYTNAIGMSLFVGSWELEKLDEFINGITDYSFTGYNCVNFAVSAWNTIMDSGYRIKYNPETFAFPTFLHNEMKQIEADDWIKYKSELNFIDDYSRTMANNIKDVESNWKRMEEEKAILKDRAEPKNN